MALADGPQFMGKIYREQQYPDQAPDSVPRIRKMPSSVLSACSFLALLLGLPSNRPFPLAFQNSFLPNAIIVFNGKIFLKSFSASIQLT